MAVLQASTLIAIGTVNLDFRLAREARGVLINANGTAKGAGATTLSLTLQFFDDASKTYVALKDSTAAGPVAVTLPAQAITPTENFTLTVYPSFGQPITAGAKERFFSAAVPASLRLVAVVAVDTLTFSVTAKSLY
jgi:hypothetical protein